MKSERTASITEQSRNARDEEARTSSLKHPYDLVAVSLSHQELYRETEVKRHFEQKLTLAFP